MGQAGTGWLSRLKGWGYWRGKAGSHTWDGLRLTRQERARACSYGLQLQLLQLGSGVLSCQSELGNAAMDGYLNSTEVGCCVPVDSSRAGAAGTSVRPTSRGSEQAMPAPPTSLPHASQEDARPLIGQAGTGAPRALQIISLTPHSFLVGAVLEAEGEEVEEVSSRIFFPASIALSTLAARMMPAKRGQHSTAQQQGELCKCSALGGDGVQRRLQGAVGHSVLAAGPAVPQPSCLQCTNSRILHSHKN